VVLGAEDVEVGAVDVAGGALVPEEADAVVAESRLGAVTEPDDPGSPEQAPRNRARTSGAAVTTTAPVR
jgi:hypothetical protein